jgi:hypothetical protein
MDLNQLRHGQMTDDEFVTDEARRSRPWTEQDYIRLKRAAEAMVRTHTSVDLAGERVMPAFDGDRYWDLLEALDRIGTGD